MSASEKLKVLAPDVDDVLWGKPTQTLWDALPQIVAVVEAAEVAYLTVEDIEDCERLRDALARGLQQRE